MTARKTASRRKSGGALPPVVEDRDMLSESWGKFHCPNCGQAIRSLEAFYAQVGEDVILPPRTNPGVSGEGDS